MVSDVVMILSCNLWMVCLSIGFRALCYNFASGSGDALDAYMPYLSAKRQAANSVLKSSAERAGNARAAEARGDHRESIRLWRIILGGEFPAYG